MAPSAIPDVGLTKPAAGVIATNPTTIAVAAPTAVVFFVRVMSSKLHTTNDPIGANIVLQTASAPDPFAASALPPSKPNHPNQRSPAPSNVKGTFCGMIACRA